MTFTRPGIGLGFTLGVNFNAGSGVGGFGASFNTSFSDINTGLFGVDTGKSGTGTSKNLTSSSVNTTENLKTGTNKTTTEQLKVDEEGIVQLIDNILKGNSGLSDIFATQGAAGLTGSSVAKQGTEDLLAKIAGEIALLTGVKTTGEAGETTGFKAGSTGGVKISSGESTSTSSSESSGILDQVGGFIDKLF